MSVTVTTGAQEARTIVASNNKPSNPVEILERDLWGAAFDMEILLAPLFHTAIRWGLICARLGAYKLYDPPSPKIFLVSHPRGGSYESIGYARRVGDEFLAPLGVIVKLHVTDPELFDWCSEVD